MAERNLGKLLVAYGTSPVYLQRAAIVAIVSFVFFLLMLFAFSLRQNIGYFLLATAFLIVQLFTLSGWIMLKRSGFKLYEKGFSYKKNIWLWDEIDSIAVNKGNNAAAAIKSCEIKKKTGEKIVLTDAIHGIESIAARIETETARNK